MSSVSLERGNPRKNPPVKGPGVRLAPDKKIDEIIEAAIDAAPECVRQRVILPSIDWSLVSPHNVGLLLGSLAQARMAVPGWLAKSLLVAGHTISEDLARSLRGAHAVLNRLNCASGELHERDAISAALGTLALDADIDPELVVAIIRRLVALSWDSEALHLALSQLHRVPNALKPAAELFGKHVARLPAARMRVSGFSTIHSFAEMLTPAFAAQGWRADVREGDFGSALTDLIAPPEGVDALVLLLDLDGILQRNWRQPAGELLAVLTERADMLGSALDVFSSRAGVPLLISTIPVPPAPGIGFLDRHHAAGVRNAVDTINRRILDAAAASSRIVVIDADHALSTLPARDQVDPKLWYYGRLPYSSEATRLLAFAFADAWKLLKRGPAKVVAVDFDNTLWGGVYGDDGLERLACGDDFPGNAFLGLQQECLRLKGQGLLLVGLSKNNPDAMSVFGRHLGMALKAEDFASVAVNWESKADNIRKIARELNLGLDSFLFLDDSPHEREAMRRLCPEVLVPEMPLDPAERPLWLRRLAATWPVRLTAEDEARADLYEVGRKAEAAKAEASSLEDYLRGLEQRLVLSFVGRDTLVRVAQMHQRTNQFNLTTRRLTESDIAGIAGDEGRGIVVLGKVSDRFGDHGIVIVATVIIHEREAVIHTLLMSCRVIGREVERAFLGELLRELRQRGVTQVRGDYIPTAKNAMVRDFYENAGFTASRSEDEGATAWSLTIGKKKLPASKFVTVSWET